MKKLFKIIALTLSMAVGLVIMSPVEKAKADTNNKRTNFQFISRELDNTVYTYDENGEHYKVVEKGNKDLNYVDSKIYKKDVNGEYQLDYTTVTEIVDGIAKFETTKNGQTSIETMDLKLSYNEQKSSNKARSFLNNVELNGGGLITPYSDAPGGGGTDLGPWEYNGTFYNSTRIVRYTVIAVTAVLAAVMAPALGGSIYASGASAAVGAIAGDIVSEYISIVYYKRVVYYRHLTLSSGMKVPRAERTTTTVYRDSSRTSVIRGSVTCEYYSN